MEEDKIEFAGDNSLDDIVEEEETDGLLSDKLLKEDLDEEIALDDLPL